MEADGDCRADGAAGTPMQHPSRAGDDRRRRDFWVSSSKNDGRHGMDFHVCLGDNRHVCNQPFLERQTQLRQQSFRGGGSVNAPVFDQPTVATTRSRNAPSQSSPLPFIAAMLLIVLGAVALVYFRGHQKLGTPGVKVVAVPLRDEKGNAMTQQSVPLPENVLDFKSQPIPITEPQLHALPGDTTYGRRLYFTDDGFQGGRRRCFDGVGPHEHP